MDRNVLYDYQLVSSDMARCRNIFNTLTNVNIILCQMLILNIIAYCFLKLFLYPFLSIWGIKSEAPYTGDGKWVFCRDGRAFLWTFAFPRSSIFPSHSALLFDIFFAFPCALAFLFRIPMLLYQSVWVRGGGANHHTRAVCVRTDQAGRVNSPPRHYLPSSRV